MCSAAQLLRLCELTVKRSKSSETLRLRTKLYKFGWYTSANNARMKNSKDLILGEVVYIAIIYRIPDYWLYLLNGYVF